MKFQVPGFSAGAVAAGIKKKDRKDLALVFSEIPACAAGVFTTNKVQAAPVLLDKKRIVSGCAQAIIANSGNANACTGPQGMKDAKAMAKAAAQALGIQEEMVLVASTGVIGKTLDIPVIETAVPGLVKQLSPEGLTDLAEAIMTTDTFPKIVSKQGRIGDKTFTVGAVAKGAGMIRPDMATMLCFVCTDMGAEPGVLEDTLKKAVDGSFNTITIDGDTSTNDTVLIMANGLSGLDLRQPTCQEMFQEVLNQLLHTLSMQIVEDGEGATKLVQVEVRGAKTEVEAKKVAYTVAESPLVKTAFFGQDANWGRIIAAVGRAGVPLNAETVQVFFNDVQMVKDGQGCGPDAESKAMDVLKKKHFTLTIDLQLGTATARVHTCDFSTDYVKINADYRT